MEGPMDNADRLIEGATVYHGVPAERRLRAVL